MIEALMERAETRLEGSAGLLAEPADGASQRHATVRLVGTPPEVRTQSGASACLGEQGESLIIRNAEGAVVCEFDAQSGRLTVASGKSLHVTAPSNELRLSAECIRLTSRETRLEAETFRGEIKRARWNVDMWELQATRLHERTRDTLRDIEHSLEVRTAQARTLVSNTWELVTGRTRMRSRENTSIDGKRILLG